MASPQSSSLPGGKISRTEIMARAHSWLDRNPRPPYDSDGSCPDPQGRHYRTDCSGYVSMAWHLDGQPSTVFLPDLANEIGHDALQPGDVLMVGGAGTEGAGGHVVLFGGWANDRRSEYHAYELCGSSGMTYSSNMRYPYWSDNPGVYLPYQYRNATPDGGGEPGDGSLVRDLADGAIYVLAGGAKFLFANMSELTETGFGADFTNVAHETITRIPFVPHNGTLLRDPGTGLIVVVVGGAQFPFASPNELAESGYTARAVNVPGRHLTALPTAPHDHTLLRDPVQGAVYVVAGRAKIAFASPQELTGSGYDWTQWNVPPRHLTAMPDLPHDGTLLRDPDTGRIFVIAGGAKFDFANATELTATGYGWTQVNVPARYLATLAAIPADGTVLRSPATGQQWRISNGRRVAVDTIAADEMPAATAIPDRLLAEIPLA